MGAITPAVSASIFTAFNTQYQKAYNALPAPWSEGIATKVPSGAESEIYVWSGHVPELREWIGARQLDDVSTFSQTVLNRPYERTIKVPRTKVEDDQWRTLAFTLTQGLAFNARKTYDILMAKTLVAGTTTLCADGGYFFSTTHPINKYVGDVTAANQSNYSASGLALTHDNYATVRATMMGYKGEGGVPLGVMPDTLLVPPLLEARARLIAEASFTGIATQAGQTVAGSTENIWKGSCRVVVAPELAGADTTWYLLDTKSRGISPLIIQERQAPRFVNLTAPNDNHVFMNNEFLYGVDMRGATALSMWWMAYKAVG